MITAIIVAAGAGSRLGEPEGMPKALRTLGDRPMYLHALQTFDAHARVDARVLVYPAIWEAQILEDLEGKVRGPLELVAGGATRQESVAAGLSAASDAEFVVVHDAARPFVTATLIDRVLDACLSAGAAICAIPVTDTLKRVSSGFVSGTLERAELVHVQTPQAFSADLLRRAHAGAARAGLDATDDAALVEALGEKVAVVDGDEGNIKITTKADLERAQAIV